jgi:hypothetical protein
LNDMICRLCQRPRVRENEYCKYHLAAFSQLQKKYFDWKLAFENLSWERYLETIQGLSETGDLGKAVAIEELKKIR